MRLNFEVTERFGALLEYLQQKTGTTKKGVILAGMLHLKWCVDQLSQGRIIVAIDPEDAPSSVHHLVSEFSLAAGVEAGIEHSGRPLAFEK